MLAGNAFIEPIEYFEATQLAQKSIYQQRHE